MSNLARKLLIQGFVAEADALCTKAMKVDDFDKAIGETVVKVRELPESEEKKTQEALDEAAPISEFFQQFGSALIQGLPCDIQGKWVSPNCTLEVSLSGGTFAARGEYKQSNALLAAFGGAGTTNYREEYIGNVCGRGIEGRVSRKDEKGETRAGTLLAGAESDLSVMMLVSKDGKEIRVLEQSGATPKFYSLVRHV